jgi:tRNA dimethylallyltransferase
LKSGSLKDQSLATHNTILIAGPTASGKSGLALQLASRLNGVIINTDSMQVYSDLRHVTARPSAGEEAEVPHRLYGHIDAATVFSTGAWLRAVESLLPQLQAAFETLIFVGGTGLYFNALTAGFSDIPQTPEVLRLSLRTQLNKLGSAALHAQLQTEDAISAAQLDVSDGQRIIRALEVLRNTGRPISDWHKARSVPLIDLDSPMTKAIVLVPGRDVLAAHIHHRFTEMVGCGALDEVRVLLERNLDPQLPAMKAIGVAEISAFLHGHTTLQSAVELSVIASRQYAKRQRTWFRGQMDARWQRFENSGGVLQSFGLF